MSQLALWLGVALLGGAGSVARFVLDAYVTAASPARFPLGTLVVNITGAAVLGLLAGLSLPAHLYLLAGTATVGSYTTFSTWVFETHRLAEDDRYWPAAVNVLVSVALGVGAVELGRLIAGA